VLSLLQWITQCDMTDGSYDKRCYIPRRIRGRVRRHHPVLHTINTYIDSIAVDMANHPWFQSTAKISQGRNKIRSSSRPFKLRCVGWNRRALQKCSLLALADIAASQLDQFNREQVAYTASSRQVAHSQFDTDSFPIRVDNCATRSMSFCRHDFEKGSLHPSSLMVKGFGQDVRSQVTHKGTIIWQIVDDLGTAHTIRLPDSLLIPRSTDRLLYPQHWAQQAKDNYPMKQGTYCSTYEDEVVLHWDQGQHVKTIKLEQNGSNVATLWSRPGYTKSNAFLAAALVEKPVCYEVVTDDEGDGDEDDLSIATKEDEPSIGREGIPRLSVHPTTTFDLDGKGLTPARLVEPDLDLQLDASSELLRLHHRLSHIPMSRLQAMAREGVVKRRLAHCRVPTCQACLYGKATRKPWQSKKAKDEPKSISATAPGGCVSVDQLESTTPGLIGQMKGILTKQRYTVATVFVDQYSDLSYVHLQPSTSAADTIQAKRAFELYASTHGVKILHYHADNGRFADNAWRKDVRDNQQRLTFCGVNAHHQNGRAEKRIRDLQDMARTSLIHAQRRWPKAINAHLWPYALRKANESLNNTIHRDRSETALEKFSGVKVRVNIKDEHPFGCPTYALDSDLQSRKSIGKWEDRARMAVYLGPSPQHASSVGLILSLKTGLVSPQFHVHYDDTFETVRNLKEHELPPSLWQSKAGFGTFTPQSSEALKRHPAQSRDVVDTEVGEIPVSEFRNEAPQPEGETTAPPLGESILRESNTDPQPPPTLPPAVVTTRSGRISRQPIYHEDYVAYSVLDYPRFTEVEFGHVDPVSYSVNYDDLDIKDTHAIAMSASNDPDTLYMHEAMKATDREQFIKAMVEEVEAHTKNGHWKIVKRSSVPLHQQVLPAVWAMRRKRRIETQEVYKWKARLNIHGGKQTKGVNFWETYAPVATWSSIRLVMNLAAINRWQTRQLDFVLAFPQADVETDLYMEVPQGFNIQGDRKTFVLKLVKNLYGQKQAGRVWYKHLSRGLIEKLQFVQSKYDPCMFWRGKSVLVIYTDDTILTGPHPSELDKIVDDLGKVFNITSSPVVEDFLGVKITRNHADSSYTLTQPHLIKSIIDDVGLQANSNERAIPALASLILHSFDKSEAHNEPWSYRAVIGKLNFLEKSTRPDIAYAVHQCARFCQDPKVEHTKAVKLIVRYLKGTHDKGIMCCPNTESFNCYCDADFAGNWNPEIAEEDSVTARSRTGYVVMYAGCPIVWGSKLQTEIALSSTESEYVALSQSLREVLPLMNLVREMATAGFEMNVSMPAVHCKVFEDNSGALEMAKVPKMRPRTKHMNIKYHHFRDAVERGLVTIHKIGTEDQLADIFTKPLGDALYIKQRIGILGW
jgi:Reverse transcriptase (RNA-dependent DNA polymerase)